MKKLKLMKDWMANLNLSLNFICYTSLLAGLYFGTLTDYLYIFLVYIFIGIHEQAFFHRMLSHRSWDAPNWIKVIGIHISTLSLLGPVVCWVSLHRQHHQYSDTEKDPHSPLFMKNWKIQFLSSRLQFNVVYAADMVKNKIAFFYTYYYLHVILISWAVIAVIFGIKNFFLIWLAGTGLSLIFANSINTWHHGRIYWPGQTRVSNVDTSKNDLVMGYLGFDGWHNNHHVNPKKYYYGNKWWQLDFCGMYIWVISTVTGYKNFLRR